MPQSPATARHPCYAAPADSDSSEQGHVQPSVIPVSGQRRPFRANPPDSYVGRITAPLRASGGGGRGCLGGQCRPGCCSARRVADGRGLRAVAAWVCVSRLWCQWQSVRTLSTVVCSPGCHWVVCAAWRLVVAGHRCPVLRVAVHRLPSRVRQASRIRVGTWVGRLFSQGTLVLAEVVPFGAVVVVEGVGCFVAAEGGADRTAPFRAAPFARVHHRSGVLMRCSSAAHRPQSVRSARVLTPLLVWFSLLRPSLILRGVEVADAFVEEAARYVGGHGLAGVDRT